MLPAAAALVDWYAVARDDRRTEVVAKPLVLVSLIVAAVVLGATDSTAGRWLLVALFFGLVGDVALLGDSLARFQAGLGAFLVGHLAFVVCFVALGLHPSGGRRRSAWPRWPSPWWPPAGCCPETHRLRPARRCRCPVAVYMAVIGAMLVVAWLTGEPLVAAGATVFVASDAILSVNRFVRPVPHAPAGADGRPTTSGRR